MASVSPNNGTPSPNNGTPRVKNVVPSANWAKANAFNSNAFTKNFNNRKAITNNDIKLNSLSYFLNDVAYFISRCFRKSKNMNASSRALEEFRVRILEISSLINEDIMQINPKNTNIFYNSQKVNNYLKSYFFKVLSGKFGVKTNKNRKTQTITPIRKITVERVVSLMNNDVLIPVNNKRNSNSNVTQIIQNTNNLSNYKNEKDYTRLNIIMAMIKRLLSNPNLKPVKSDVAQNSLDKFPEKGEASLQKRITTETEFYNAINQKIQSALLSIVKYEANNPWSPASPPPNNIPKPNLKPNVVSPS